MDETQSTEEQRAETFRQFHTEHLNRQTKAIESIQTYVSLWFWLSVIGAVLFIVMSIAAANSQY